jgi:hypothetical protein
MKHYQGKFADLPVGAFLKNSGDKWTDVFLKIPERKVGLHCKCGKTYNAVNISSNGPFTVHFCDSIIVEWNIHARRFDFVVELMKEQG